MLTISNLGYSLGSMVSKMDFLSYVGINVGT